MSSEIEAEYYEIKQSGLFHTYFPELSGVWKADKEEFTDFWWRREQWLQDQIGE